MKIRKALLEDAKELFLLEEKLFSKENFALSKASFRYHIKNSLLYVAEVNFEIVGYVLVLLKRKNPKLYSIGVSKNHRGKKIATKLLVFVIDILKLLKSQSFFLEVRVDNVIAITLYKNMGFSIQKRVKSFYRDGCDAYIMHLCL